MKKTEPINYDNLNTIVQDILATCEKYQMEYRSMILVLEEALQWAKNQHNSKIQASQIADMKGGFLKTLKKLHTDPDKFMDDINDKLEGV